MGLVGPAPAVGAVTFGDMPRLTDDEAREIEEGIPIRRGPILITWIRRLLDDRRARIAEERGLKQVASLAVRKGHHD